MDYETVLRDVQEIARGFAEQRADRQRRRELDPADFDALGRAGFLLTGVPGDQGGLWEDPARSTRATCELLRALAHGDSSVALVAAMHPTILSFWNAVPEAPAPHRAAWDAQRRWAAVTAADGAWWGTIVSEPGSGGDIANTKAVARPSGGDSHYLLSGQKHFGSGSGIVSYMITSAVPAGEREPDWFFLDLRGIPWDGSRGITLLAPWDGHGMTATQSHAFEYHDLPATRFAWPGQLRAVQEANGGFIPCCFTAVIVGIVEVAVEMARAQVRRRSAPRPYEQVEWARVEQEAWLIEQAYEGMLRALETKGRDRATAVLGKTAVAELAESALGRISRILGGGTYSRYAPFGHWAEDVRALGFLRPPWPLAFEAIFQG